MRVITNTHTGSIVSDTDLNLEYLYVGDYGKQNNIKADFLGYTKRKKPYLTVMKLLRTSMSMKNLKSRLLPRVGM